MPPQFPTKPSAAMAGAKRPAFLPAASPPPRKLARPASAPCLPALAPKKPAPRPVPPPAARPRPPPPPAPASRHPKKPAPAPADAEAAPCRAAESVHPSRRLACGTAVTVRTRLLLDRHRCCLLLWLPARVVSSSDAYHCTVKYAAHLNPTYAGKIVRVPAADVRQASSSHRPSSSAKPEVHVKSRPQPTAVTK
ncbi:hypothetical protein QYE76_060090 [Lolium multiflorum]|uniref:Uncharacterized protein n=1 Tax=Lolium multiflorum TaxID=4521 RepID=A0AAD8S0J7_LOLMU|nr:hypothetical protein QYE76_060086 [Lolium multiflorum]KAK1642285.1 hypothetical protein QYE76_060090 [Lolium multiflorum]